MAELVGPDIDRFVQLADTFDRHHPAEPLYYCQFLATLPAMQGQGIGSTLLSVLLDRADHEAMPAYHEATTPRNRALYPRSFVRWLEVVRAGLFGVMEMVGG